MLLTDSQCGNAGIERAAKAQMAEIEPPALSEDELWYYQAYRELQYDRPVLPNGGMHPIPISVMISYADHLDLDVFERDLLIRVVRAIDLTECNIAARKSGEKRKSGR